MSLPAEEIACIMSNGSGSNMANKEDKVERGCKMVEGERGRVGIEIV
jgi:hypothetical protein